MVVSIVIFFLFALFEEVGWRGYLAPKMYSLGINVYLAHALVALVWASWHLPFIHELSTYTSEGLVSYIPRFYLGAFAFSIVAGSEIILTSRTYMFFANSIFQFSNPSFGTSSSSPWSFQFVHVVWPLRLQFVAFVLWTLGCCN